MKARLGFVSNSSTASFIADLEVYNSVLSLAKKMLKVIIEDEDWLLHDEEELDYYQNLLKKFKMAEKNGLDPNMPVMFHTLNFETFIVKKEDGYYVDTDSNTVWDDFMEGLDFLDNPDETFNLNEKYQFYILEYDVIGKFVRVYADTTPCKDGHHDPWYEGVELPDGRLICLECEKGNYQEFQIIKEE